ncbi:flagellar hook-basal body complex protein [Haematospirillum jordaniae]|uniref:flagellar hook-basal body complex protein n=1 Tax=Haematospirillum jordaniae TaxID=1549855 RepID=UPI001432B922|nr:flagellar hook-basal body complex protein [Haematospirillum jordaniae]NKD45180.1 flagellar hook-basal body complex protein [Haematospirillum jordaniae]NKD56234.1 flagellar hook-basal body complex protein [Haematospirillum jordaniae]NKD78294.1 flagellar hook-basal body complex protein [Haematospirillum jordaniae]NKD82583.1 flagellar hook-basal body complex protein [Haematospirillum jordaniae]NKD85038.1 flagellar hook-basal body complex protein [Haematospirillum jordaniae]
MSLYGALFAGVSGLSAQSTAMGAIADNVTNINTIGYKGTKTNFATFVTRQVSSTSYSAGGVQSRPRTGVDIQGLLQSSTSSTDVGISGAGFFVVSKQALNSTGFGYSRAGSFKIDKDGYLQNVGGYYLQGWPLENWDGSLSAATVVKDGNTYMKSYKNNLGETYYMNDNAIDNVNLQPMNLSSIGGTARATSILSIAANLPSGALVGATEKTNAPIFDSLGNSHNLNFSWIKRGQNQWDYEAMPPEGTTYLTLDDQTDAKRVYFAAGRIDFSNIPANGKTMTMALGGNNYTFRFSTIDPTSGYRDDGATANTTTVGGTLPVNGDTLQIGGITFTVRNPGPASNATEVDVSGLSNATAVANQIAQTAQSYFSTRLGPGNWVTSVGAQIQSSLAIGAGTGNLVTGAYNDITGGTVANNEFVINTTGKSLSQILDILGKMINTASSASLNDASGRFPPSPPANLAIRVAGENGIMFRQFSAIPGQEISVDASALEDINNQKSVLQSTVFTVPALGPSMSWIKPTGGEPPAVKFNGDGTINELHGSDETTAVDPRLRVRVGWANGALNMDGSTPLTGGSPGIALFLGNYNSPNEAMQQKAGAYQLNKVAQNGNKFGNFAGLTIGEDGVVTARFDNGVTIPIFMIPLATFVNPNGMNSQTGNVFQETSQSGLPTLREAGSGTAGIVSGASLEASTVDLGEEFTTMITTQRAYSAASKIITTTDQMLDELVNIKR